MAKPVLGKISRREESEGNLVIYLEDEGNLSIPKKDLNRPTLAERRLGQANYVIGVYDDAINYAIAFWKELDGTKENNARKVLAKNISGLSPEKLLDFCLKRVAERKLIGYQLMGWISKGKYEEN